MAKGKGGGGGGGGSRGSSAPVARVTQTSNSNNPSANTRTVTPINGATQAQANKAVAKGDSGGSSKPSYSNAGAVLSKKEAQAIAERKDKTIAEVMANAQGRGIGLGSSLVNNFNAGNLGPNFRTTGFTGNGAVPVQRGQTAGAMQALQMLQGLQGLRMPTGTAYMGASTTTTPAYSNNDPQSGSTYVPGRTTYNPIVVPRGYAGGGAGAGGAGGGNGRGRNGNAKNDGTIESMKSLYQQQMDAGQARIDEFMNKQAEQINALTLDFQDQLAAAQASADERIGGLTELMMMQQQQAESTQQLLTAQAQAAQAAYEEQARQASALGRAYVPGVEASAASAILGDQRTTTRDQTANSLNNLAIVSDLGSNTNPLAGLQLA